MNTPVIRVYDDRWWIPSIHHGTKIKKKTTTLSIVTTTKVLSISLKISLFSNILYNSTNTISSEITLLYKINTKKKYVDNYIYIFFITNIFLTALNVLRLIDYIILILKLGQFMFDI